MRLPGDEGQGRSGASVVYTIIGVAVFVLAMVFVLLKSNDTHKSGSEYLKEMQEQEEEMAEAESEEEQTQEPEKKLRAQDLDFWDMYPVEDEEEKEGLEETEAILSGEPSKPSKSTFAEKAEKERQEQKQKEQEAQEEVQNDPSKDGKHTLITNRDGTDEWVLMNPYLTKNTFDSTKMEEKAGLKRYMGGHFQADRKR